jgi:hypothetical protein
MSEKKKTEGVCWRCSQCSIHWPMLKDYSQCPLCESECFTTSVDTSTILSNAQAQGRIFADKNEPEELAPPANLIHPPQVYSHRFAIFMDMGFGPAEAETLANTREDTHRIKKMLTQGCDIDTAVLILL